ncbi:uncharacterized protein LOC130815652 [Amaranthus tricolor]|uniref:uncharacterized protein LOC130815652 n=1 Tax=Amaranthus tricolor TaxID=29722 RepID=UPI00258F0298|nr:uncharacterized protein LOC130815652 [Amaranthus tricolor]
MAFAEVHLSDRLQGDTCPCFDSRHTQETKKALEEEMDVSLSLEEDAEGDPEEEAEEFHEDNAEGGYNADMEVEAVDREDIMSESDSDNMMWGGEPPEQGDIMKIVELSDSEEQLDMSDSLSVKASTDSESTSGDDFGDADFDPDLYEQDRDRMDASPFTK